VAVEEKGEIMALRGAKRTSSTVVIQRLRLPGLKAGGLVRQLPRLTPVLPIILILHFWTTANRIAATNRRYDYVLKPSTFREMLCPGEQSSGQQPAMSQTCRLGGMDGQDVMQSSDSSSAMQHLQGDWRVASKPF